MVPGDIDLTENLDFRKSRKAIIPKIPWEELHGNFISEDMLNTAFNDDTEFRITTSSSSISTTSMHISYSSTRTYNFYIQYDNGLF